MKLVQITNTHKNLRHKNPAPDEAYIVFATKLLAMMYMRKKAAEYSERFRLHEKEFDPECIELWNNSGELEVRMDLLDAAPGDFDLKTLKELILINAKDYENV